MESDFLVIGSGIAGLSFALKAADLGSVTVVTKKKQVDSATNLAQGGIAAVLDKSDDFENHIKDTLESGAGLCDEEVVRMVVKDGPERIHELICLGVEFVKNNDGSLSLGKEGGHSNRRVAHAFDLTGREIERALIDKVHKKKNITVLENHTCIELVTEKNTDVSGEKKKKCVGAFVLDNKGSISFFSSKVTLLCTGGAGKVYLYTSNPDIATGDGIALAFRAGAVVANMEFVQFHPTCLYHLNAKNFLISEAVRGEGAILINKKGERFIEKYEPEQKELATRDKVARAIDEEMKKTGVDCVYLDISHKDASFVQRRFPAIYGKCLSLGIDITREPIPVVPAAHYLCGGILTNETGETSVINLFSLGESACTGLHGGNRLASNSLLEALVYAEKAYQHNRKLWGSLSKTPFVQEKKWEKANEINLDEEIIINHNWDVIRRIMWNYVGISRKESRLKIAEKKIKALRVEISEIVQKYKITSAMMELCNISLVAYLIIKAALKRNESRGLHYLIDRPEPDEKQKHWNTFSLDKFE
jgi:L-aspartate oxidase